MAKAKKLKNTIKKVSKRMSAAGIGQVLQTPKPATPEPKGDVTKEIYSALEEPYNHIFSKAVEKHGNDLKKLRDHIQEENGESQQNLQVIIDEIDKY